MAESRLLSLYRVCIAKGDNMEKSLLFFVLLMLLAVVTFCVSFFIVKFSFRFSMWNFLIPKFVFGMLFFVGMRSVYDAVQGPDSLILFMSNIHIVCVGAGAVFGYSSGSQK